MCGIAGVFNRDGAPASPAIVKAMTDAIAHRGPDGEGHWADGPVALGHRRLSIIDLTDAGRQPIQTSNGRFTLTYNGEIYNYLDLRLALQAEGVTFRSRTDTEVLLKGIAAWGLEATLARLNGMFAFAIYDREARALTLARDRFGVKPLYYAASGGTLAFASEIKAILAHPRFEARLDPEGLVEYLTFQNFFTDRTLFGGVRLLPAGCYVTLGLARNGAAQDVETRIRRYWDYHFEEPLTQQSEADYVEELKHLFAQAVTRQLVSDVEIGAYLSGGMDSGSITALAAGQLPFMRTFTCGFDLSSASGIELSFDERAAAERMSYLFGTEHYEMVLKSGDMERAMPKLAWHLEEPRVGQSYPNYYVARLASKFNKVVLAGTGGDELFGGYPWRYYRAVANTDFEDYVDKYFAFWQRIFNRELLEKACAPIWSEVSHIDTRQIFRDVFKAHADRMTRPEDYVNHSLYFEAKTFMHGLLVVEDKLSMAHGLETRVPFLDNDLVDFAMRLPVAHKLGNLVEVVRLNENDQGAKTTKYFQKTRDGKLLLRKMMASIIPEDITEREKAGFSAPDASWFKGESIDYVRERLLDPQARIFGLFDYRVISETIDRHLEGKENLRLLIWSLLSLEEVFERYRLA